MRPERVNYFLKMQLGKLKLDYIDLYLIHSPMGFQYVDDKTLIPMRDGKILLDKTTNLEAIWKEMERQVDYGLTKSIGISNFNHKQVERIVKVSRILPANHQIEMNVYCQQKEIREFCEKYGITFVSYATLGSPGRKALYESRGVTTFKDPGILNDPVIKAIAEKHNKTTAQVALRYFVQQGVAVIPKSINPSRLRQNLDVSLISL